MKTSNGHDLWEKGDEGCPDAIKDRNGDIVLGLCKVCGKGEADLSGNCVDIRTADDIDMEAIHRDIDKFEKAEDVHSVNPYTALRQHWNENQPKEFGLYTGDDKLAFEVLRSAMMELERLGWKGMEYAPKDGTVIAVIEPFCSAAVAARYEESVHGWFSFGHGDSWPSRPVLWRPLKEAEERARPFQKINEGPRAQVPAPAMKAMRHFASALVQKHKGSSWKLSHGFNNHEIKIGDSDRTILSELNAEYAQFFFHCQPVQILRLLDRIDFLEWRGDVARTHGRKGDIGRD